MIPIGVSLRHYKRKDIAEAIAKHSEDREIGVRFGEKFGQRPDTIRHAADVLEFAKKGATSFHCSEERWKNPLGLSPTLRRKDLDNLRKGWDLVLDIDCSVFEYSRIAAELVIKALKYHGVESISVKFSGNKGFHIGVPFEDMPSKINGMESSDAFPETPKRVAYYLRDMIAEALGKEIIKYENGAIKKIVGKTGVERNKIVKEKKDSLGNKSIFLDTEPFLAIDTVLISSRHMYRMPYSLHEKSGLVSLPINIDEVPTFERDMGKPENVKVSNIEFLERKISPPTADKLIVQAFDSKPEEIEDEKKVKAYEIPAQAIPEQLFPECIKKILNGLSDGRKRSLFILINFLRSAGWEYDAIESRLMEWNKVNNPPLRETSIVGQVRYQKQQKKNAPPPNCSNKAYYQDIGVKCDERICSKVINPINFSKRKQLIK